LDGVLFDGMRMMVGGFGTCGLPENLIKAVTELPVKDITTISNDVGTDDHGLSTWSVKKQVKRYILSGIWFSRGVSDLYLAGEVELELTPQGSLAERMRCGGLGIPAFFTPAASDTVIEHGGFPIRVNPKNWDEPIVAAPPREYRVFNDRKYLMEEALSGDVSLVYAKRGDKFGNLQFHATARNFNPLLAMASKITIAEVEELVDPGVIPADEVHLPGVFVHRIFEGKDYVKPMTFLKTNPVPQEGVTPEPQHTTAAAFEDMSAAEIIGRRAALEYTDGMTVNLGIGMPTRSSNHVAPDIKITLQSENGALGVGPYPFPDEVDPDLVNAGTETITMNEGSAFFDSATSFGMIRGQHVDVTVLGGMQVSETGDLANWVIPGVLVKGMGGAMDLVSSGSKVVVTMEHCTKKGGHKLMQECELPLTGKGVVSRIITELAVFDIDKKTGAKLLEKSPVLTLEDLRARTGFEFDAEGYIEYRMPRPE
jgi:3-oxoacid CoA-transferase